VRMSETVGVHNCGRIWGLATAVRNEFAAAGLPVVAPSVPVDSGGRSPDRSPRWRS
jgi:hypothetical protein